MNQLPTKRRVTPHQYFSSGVYNPKSLCAWYVSAGFGTGTAKPQIFRMGTGNHNCGPPISGIGYLNLCEVQPRVGYANRVCLLKKVLLFCLVSKGNQEEHRKLSFWGPKIDRPNLFKRKLAAFRGSDSPKSRQTQLNSKN